MKSIVQDVDALVREAKFVLILWANPQTQDFWLLEPGHVPHDATRVFRERGLFFCGAFALLKGGKPKTVLNELGTL